MLFCTNIYYLNLVPSESFLCHASSDKLYHLLSTEECIYTSKFNLFTLLYGVADGVHQQLQSATRMITGIRQSDHIAPILRDTLHWLPITARHL